MNPIAAHILGMSVSFIIGFAVWAYAPPLAVILLPMICFHFGFLFRMICDKKESNGTLRV